MKNTNALRLLGLAGIGSLIAAPSFAQEGGYPYAGVSIGQSRAKIDQERITANLLAGGLTSTGMSRDERDTAYKLFGGYQLNRYVGLEGGYFDLGKFGFTSTTLPAGTLNGRIKLQGVNLDVVGTLPLTDRFSVIGRLGGQYARARDNFDGSGAVRVFNPSPSKREFNVKFGAGLQYEVSQSFLVRAEAERYRINDAVGNHGDVNVFSLSLVFPFGRAPASASRALAAAPAYEPPAPQLAAPPPVAVAPRAPVAAPAPERRRVNFSADALFAFGQSAIRPEGRMALDKFTKELDGTQFDSVTVEGHTDRLGSKAYNQALSERRARSVSDYLSRSGGIAANKITAVGKDGSLPVTRPSDCKGSKPTAKLIACLQPDRRVAVEVVGTR